MLEPEFELAGIVEEGHALLAAAAKVKPDLILLEILIPAPNGIDSAIVPRQSNPSLSMCGNWCSRPYLAHGMREFAQSAYRGEHQPHRRKQNSDCADQQRSPHSHGLCDGAARERAQRQNAVEEQVHRGIDTPQKMIRCDRLP
jgi:hypothetical protein